MACICKALHLVIPGIVLPPASGSWWPPVQTAHLWSRLLFPTSAEPEREITSKRLINKTKVAQWRHHVVDNIVDLGPGKYVTNVFNFQEENVRDAFYRTRDITICFSQSERALFVFDDFSVSDDFSPQPVANHVTSEQLNSGWSVIHRSSCVSDRIRERRWPGLLQPPAPLLHPPSASPPSPAPPLLPLSPSPGLGSGASARS